MVVVTVELHTVLICCITLDEICSTDNISEIIHTFVMPDQNYSMWNTWKQKQALAQSLRKSEFHQFSPFFWHERPYLDEKWEYKFMS